MPLVRALARDAAARDHRFSALVLGVVRSAPFQNNVKGVGVEVSQRAAR
jgi:hypothetical protein